MHVPLALRSRVLIVAVLAAAYPTLRRPILTWGATAEEASSRLPGDELLENADGVSTRAITIDAPASAVWPWLAQMGPAPRGGAYTYDWIENLLGLDMHSVDRVLPEFQDPKVGDTIGLGTNRMRLERVEPGHVLAWRSEDGNWVWTFVLRRARRHDAADQPQPLSAPTLAARIGMLPMEPVARDGTQDAARDQAARRATRVIELGHPGRAQVSDTFRLPGVRHFSAPRCQTLFGPQCRTPRLGRRAVPAAVPAGTGHVDRGYQAVWAGVRREFV